MSVLALNSQSSESFTPTDDRIRLQGVWTYVAGPRRAQLLIAGTRYTIRFENGDVYMGTFELDTTAKPRAMDMAILEGPKRHCGKMAHAIYALDGDRLIWYPSEPGNETRATFFPARDDKRSLCLVFERVR